MRKQPLKLVMALCGLLLMAGSCKHLASIPRVNSTNDSAYYADKPYWIDMINDTNVNYFEAIKAFESYWKNRELPTEEDLLFTDATKAKEYREEGSNENGDKNLKPAPDYRLEYKQFRHWKLTMQPYVQPDGRILTPTERLEIWKNQRK